VQRQVFFLLPFWYILIPETKMPQKKNKKGKVKTEDESAESLAKSYKNLMKAQNEVRASIGKKIQHGDHSFMLSNLSEEMQSKQKALEEEADQELKFKLLCQHLGLMDMKGGFGDGDQTPLKGDKAQVLQNQWGNGMDYNPVHPGNSHLSDWLRDLWRGDYEAVMGHIEKIDMEKVADLLEMRESLLNVSAVFHVIIGARTLCGQNPLFEDVQRAARRSMEIKNEHVKILAKLIELGANIHAKDVAGYTPLHHSLNSYSNTTTLAMARQLLEAGADPNMQNRFGCSVLFEPVMAANLDAVRLLLEFGADPDIKENDAGITPRSTASFYPAIASLFSQADKKKAKEMRAAAKTKAGGSLSACKVCKADSDTKRCTGCYLVWYCGQECQAKDWFNHKVECKVTREQYKQVQLVEDNAAGWNNITKKVYVTKVGEPNKKHFVVKVQVPLSEFGETGGALYVYNKDKSLCGLLYRDKQMEMYDMLVTSIKREGFKGQKGFYYAIYTDQKKESDYVNLKINPVNILPVEKW